MIYEMTHTPAYAHDPSSPALAHTSQIPTKQPTNSTGPTSNSTHERRASQRSRDAPRSSALGTIVNIATMTCTVSVRETAWSGWRASYQACNTTQASATTPVTAAA